MPKEYGRNQRVGAQIQRELSMVLREELDDPRIVRLTLSEVRVSGDLSQARVFVSELMESGDLAELVSLLNSHAAQLRSALGKVMRMRAVPKLLFVEDETLEEAMHLSSLIERANEDTGTEGGK